MQALHFGAGNIGKGLIGNLLSKTGYHVCFVDVDQTVIDHLNQRNSYQVELLDDDHTVETISPVSALNSMTQKEKVREAIVHADLITTSVGVNNLATVAKLLASGLLKRIAQKKKKIDIIANENAIHASQLLKKQIEQLVSRRDMDQIHAYVGFPNSAIDRLSLGKQEGGREIALVEPYFEWIIHETEMVNTQLPKIRDVSYVQDLQPYIERKLYLVNMAHATTAYLGHLAGEMTIQSALSNPKIEAVVRATIMEAAQYLLKTYRTNAKEMARFIATTLKRFKNHHIQDDVLRVGRSPIRKLRWDERLVKPTVELFRLGLPIDYLTKAIAAAFHFKNPQDEESVTLQTFIRENGIDQAITHFTQIKEAKIKDKIRRNYTRLIHNDWKGGTTC